MTCTLRPAASFLAALFLLAEPQSLSADQSVDLLQNQDLKKFRKTEGWHFVEAVSVVPGSTEFKTQGVGSVLVNGAKKAKIPYLYTQQEFGDARVKLEFTVPTNSNAGVYLQGRYEIQIFDSYSVESPKHSDLGGLYQRWDENRNPKGYEGVAPRVNAAKSPGLWQTIELTFRAPRFDTGGRKTQNARFVSVKVNGQIVHENQEVTGPTRAAQYSDEQPRGPVSIQGDHGPIAIRRFVITPLDIDERGF